MVRVTPLPDFITHYHSVDRRPFHNLSELAEAGLASVLLGLNITAESGVSERRFGPRYMSLRRATETLLRNRFIERGGEPRRSSPHYFVLGESLWFRGLYRDAIGVRVRPSVVIVLRMVVILFHGGPFRQSVLGSVGAEALDSGAADPALA